MTQQQVGVGRRFGRQTRLGADRTQEVDPRPEPARRQRMVGPEVVVGRAWPVDEQHDRHDSGCRRATIRGCRTSVSSSSSILALVLLWRGPKTLPKLGQALGRGVREAREEASKAQAEIQARASDESSTTADSDQAAADGPTGAPTDAPDAPADTPPADRRPPDTA